MRITTYGKTHVGKVRELNEDNYFVSDEHGLFLVADGMGGHAAGEVASALAVQVIANYVEDHTEGEQDRLPQEFIAEAIEQANEMIYGEASSNEEKKGMGTTVVSAFVQENYAYIAHVGDSRAYLIRQGNLEPLTNDHSWVNFQVQIGNITSEQAKYHPLKNIITKALGIQDTVDVEMSKVRLLDQDLLLLCSDGLTGMVSDEEIISIVNEQKNDLDKAVDNLIEEALKNGGEDNVTVVLLQYHAESVDDMDDTQPIVYRPNESTAETTTEFSDEEAPLDEDGAAPSTEKVSPPEDSSAE